MEEASSKIDFAVIGGGAAGFWGALAYAAQCPGASVAIYERGPTYLQKVRISGGGRCNVTHACFDPKKLAEHYPRGARELRAAFHHWQPRDTIAWFAERGVELKTEADGRMFPITDDSATIVECFFAEARKLGVYSYKQMELSKLVPTEAGFELSFADASTITAKRVLIATGSLKASRIVRAMEALGHPLEPLVPSLFAVNVNDARLSGLSGVSVPDAAVSIAKSKARRGPLLITHRGLSGPAILRLSAWEARTFAEANYHLPLFLNWLPDVSTGELQTAFNEARRKDGAKRVRNTPLKGLPKRLWERLILAADIDPETIWSQLNKDRQAKLTQELTNGRFEVSGKTTNRDEFVTAGGIQLSSINFKTMESRHTPGLYFAGECVDIDGITGGFNFQAAWTTAQLAARAAAAEYHRG